MTTAKVEYRDYIPWGWIAITFCHIDFFGDNADSLKKEWKAITHARYKKYDAIVNELLDSKIGMKDKIDLLEAEIRESKPFWRFWYTKEEKAKLKQIAEMKNDIFRLDESIKKNRSLRFMETDEEKRAIEDFLKNHGFILTNTSAAGSECITHTDIWSLNSERKY